MITGNSYNWEGIITMIHASRNILVFDREKFETAIDFTIYLINLNNYRNERSNN